MPDPFQMIGTALILAAASLIFAAVVRLLSKDSVVMTFFILFFIFLFKDPIFWKISQIKSWKENGQSFY